MPSSRIVRLGEIAHILNGVPDTKEMKEKKNSITYKFVQPNHLGVYNDIQSLSEITRSSPIDNDYFIQKDDILMKRLNPDIVVLIKENMPRTTFSSNLFVIRAYAGYYPAYVACLLEYQGISFLSSNITGTVSAIKSVSGRSIAALNVPVVEYEKQKIIGELWLLSKMRRKLLEDLIREDRLLVTAVINRIGNIR